MVTLMDWDKEDLEIMRKIKEQSDDVEIPDSILPDNIVDKLEQEEKKMKKQKNRKIIRISTCVGTVACIVAVFAGIGAKLYYDRINEKKLCVNPEHKVNADSINGAKAKESYVSIADILKKVVEKSDDLYVNRLETDEIAIEGDKSGAGAAENWDDTNSMGNSLAGETLANDVEKEESSSDVYSTNSQVEGIEEADIVKTDGRYIYAYDDEDAKLQVVDIQSESKVADLSINKDLNGKEISMPEMYIYKNYLVFVGNADDYSDGCADVCNHFYYQNDTVILVYDVSDISNITVKKNSTQEGSYNTVRLKNGIMYLITNSAISGDITEDNCVPKYDGKQIPANCVFIDEDNPSRNYIFVTTLDMNSSEFEEEQIAINSTNGSSYVYMSENNIYISKYHFGDYGEGISSNTEIWKVEFNNGDIKNVINTDIKGEIYGQFAMDEYDGYLRVVSNYYVSDGTEYNIVHVLDSEMKEIGTIDNIAEGEDVYSARFEGHIGYFVTYRQMDPLFKVDFSDPYNPVLVDELEMPGYSEYLHKWSEEELFGLGFENDNVKLAMFKVKDGEAMEVISKKILNDVWNSNAISDHKALFIDKEKNLIGLELELQNCYKSDMRYAIFSYENGEFVEKVSVELEEDTSDSQYYYEYKLSRARGLYVDDKIYIVVPGINVYVYSLNSFELLNEISLL